MGLTEAVANHVVNIQYDNIPEEAVNRVKMLLCDFLGVAIAGREYEGPLILKAYIEEQGCIAESSVPGYTIRTSAPYSALLCGTMGHVLDYDDVAHTTNGHSSVVLAPVVWALGDKYDISGKKAIEAFLAGFEGAALVGAYIKSVKPKPGIWHATRQIGIIGSAITAAKIMDLSADQIRMALGIVASMSGGFMQNFGTMTKSFHAGLSAHDGIFAAGLAKKGFTSNMNILEIRNGYRDAFQPEGEKTEEDILTLINTGVVDLASGGGVTFKRYPSCFGTHLAIYATLDLAFREDIKADDVESVVVKAQEWVSEVPHIREPKAGLEGKFSIEFTVAAALTDRKVTMAHFTDEMVKRLEPLTKKVVRVVDEPSETPRSAPQTVTITMKNGKVFTHSISGLSPVLWDELVDKYRDCMSPFFSKDDVVKSEDIIRNLENLGHFKDLVSILAK